MVRRLAAASSKWKGMNTEPREVWPVPMALRRFSPGRGERRTNPPSLAPLPPPHGLQVVRMHLDQGLGLDAVQGF